jgi:hypothetical protein
MWGCCAPTTMTGAGRLRLQRQQPESAPHQPSQRDRNSQLTAAWMQRSGVRNASGRRRCCRSGARLLLGLTEDRTGWFRRAWFGLGSRAPQVVVPVR